MTKHQKTTRTQIKDLPVSEKKLTKQEASQVKGGTETAHRVKSYCGTHKCYDYCDSGLSKPNL